MVIGCLKAEMVAMVVDVEVVELICHKRKVEEEQIKN